MRLPIWPVVLLVAPSCLKEEPLACSISSAPTYELGKAPDITVEITNRTKVDMYLVGSLDASAIKWRYPHCYFEIAGLHGWQPALDGPVGRCGNMSPLRKQDFVKVPSGGKFNPYQAIDGHHFFVAYRLSPASFYVAGEYRIRFVYSSESEQITDWLGDGRWMGEEPALQEFGELFKQVPKTRVTSNEIKITLVKAEE